MRRKSGGCRTIVGFRKKRSDRIFFLFDFPKSSRSNITRKEKDALTLNANALIEASDGQIEGLKAKSSISELECKA